jgi:tetratricopeptide (TPR) repeat protein
MSVRELYARGSVQMVAAIAIVTGVIGWIAGWRYGQGLITLAVIVYAITLVPNPRRSWYLGLARPHAEWAAKSFGAGRFEQAADDLAAQVGYLRKLAFAQPREAKDLGQALMGQWTALTKLGRHAEALVVAEEAVAVSRIVDANPAERPALDRALELVEASLSEFPDDPVGPETSELLRLRAERADDANRAEARALTIVAERHVERNEYDAARPLLEQAVRIQRHRASSEQLVNALTDLGHCLTSLGDLDQAHVRYAEALAVATSLDPSDPEDVLGLQLNVARSLRELQRYDEAVPLGRAVVATLRDDHRSETPHEKSVERLGWALSLLADDLRALGRDEEARQVEAEISGLDQG